MNKDLIPLLCLALLILLCVPPLLVVGFIIARIMSKDFQDLVVRRPLACACFLFAMAAMFGGGIWLFHIMFSGWI